MKFAKEDIMKKPWKLHECGKLPSPENSAKKLNSLVSGPVSYHVIPAGHVTLVVLFPEREITLKLISDFASS